MCIINTTYIIQSLHLLCKRTSEVEEDGSYRLDVVLQIIANFFHRLI